MIRSMTGYGRGICEKSCGKVTVEMKSVNHRYLDLNLKIPRSMNAFENDIRNRIKAGVGRGKVDVFVTYEAPVNGAYTVKYDEDVANMYLQSLRKMAEQFDLRDDVTVTQLSRYPDVLTVEENAADEDMLRSTVLEALDEALAAFISARGAEGERLAADLNEKVDLLDSYVDQLEVREPAILEEYRNRLKEKVKTLLEDNAVDESRIASEVVIYADKICIDEEMVRLHSHVKEAKAALSSGENVGRKMDFLAQEMNREANTILSKSTDVAVASLGIEMKTLIEKIREQIQNIE